MMTKLRTGLATVRTPSKWPSWLPLLSFPILLAAQLLAAPGIILFVLSIIAIIALAAQMGRSTEELAGHFGSTLGGFFNATFGNAAEFIIAIVAINAGLFDLVKASLTGSIIGNILFVMGASFFVGGLRYREQSFDVKQAGLNSTMLLIAVASMLVPSAFFFFAQSTPGHDIGVETEQLSLFVAVLMISLYVLSLVFSFHTHAYLFRKRLHEAPKGRADHAILVLLLSTVALALASEIFTHQLTGVAAQFNLSQIFMGAVVVALVGNAAEHMSALSAAKKNDLDLALAITIGSSIQIALLVAPLLVLVSYFILGTPLNLVFSLFEILAVFAAVLIVNEISSDGQTNWFEGAQLMAMYMILAGLFFFVV